MHQQLILRATNSVGEQTTDVSTVDQQNFSVLRLPPKQEIRRMLVILSTRHEVTRGKPWDD